MKLFARTVPRNKNLFSGTSLANKDFFAGTPQIGLFYILCPGNGSWGSTLRTGLYAVVRVTTGKSKVTLIRKLSWLMVSIAVILL